ncbi:MAG: hypothetical protein M1831_001815 [Alyxoria varia]|nr:MAG: hypothetical protein M1831_001815 [Alyxoria varia]
MATAGRMADKAVHLKIQPRTRTIRESREILRALKRYGTVVTFRNLQYDPVDPAPHTILAVFKDPNSATDLLKDTPLKITPCSRPANPEPSGDIAGLNHMLWGHKAGRDAFEIEEVDEPCKVFTVTADRSLEDHVARVRQTQQYWGYPLSRDKNMYTQEALRQSVPLEAYSLLPSEASQRPQRLVQKDMRKVKQRKTLWQTYQETIQEQRQQDSLGQRSINKEYD